MTHEIPTLLLLPGLLLAAGGLASGLFVWRRLRPFTPAGAMTLAAIGLVSLAPVVMLIAYGFTGTFSFMAGGLHVVLAIVMFGAARRAQVFQDNPDTASTWSYREKSAVLVFGALVVIVGTFAIRIIAAPGEAVIGIVIESVLALVLIMIAGHVVIAVLHAPIDDVNMPADERDREVELRSTRNATWILGTGMWVVLIASLFPPISLPVAMLAFGFIVLAELVWYGSLFAYYRLGAV